MKTTYKPDTAAIFGAAMSIFEEGRKLAKSNGNDLSDAYSGHDEFMRQCMRVASEFEAWACKHVDFDALGEVWPYFMHDSFGRAALDAIGSECRLSEANGTEWPLIAGMLKLPLRQDRRGWIPYTVRPYSNGNFCEELKTIQRLVGSISYEYEKRGGNFYVRRVG